MKQITTILLAGSAAIFMTACGGGSSSDLPIAPPIEPAPPAEPAPTTIPSLGNNGDYTTTPDGLGTSGSPYMVGNGMFEVKTSATEYFSFEVTSNSCNVALIDGLNITSQKTFDSSGNTISDGSLDVEVLSDLSTGIYTVAASTWHSGNPSLGIYSDCIKQYSNVELEDMGNGPHTFYFIKDLYKFKMTSDGTVTLDNIRALDHVTIYDNNWNSIIISDVSSMPEEISLPSGQYYLVPTQYAFAYRDDTTDFMFTKTY